MKKAISLLLSLVMLLSLLTVTASAEDAPDVEGHDAMTQEFEYVYIEEDLTLYEQNIYNGFLNSESFDGFCAVKSGTQFTVSNVDTDPTSFMYVYVKSYTRSAGPNIQQILVESANGEDFDFEEQDFQGKYFGGSTLQYLTGTLSEWDDMYTPTINGLYWVPMEFIDSYWAQEYATVLYAGDSATFTLPETGEDTVYVLYTEIYYPEHEYYFWTYYPIKVDDELATPQEPEVPETPADPGNPFTDVPADAYYHDAVLWALENGVTTGATATTFDPDSTCTRGQVATFLWRAKGCPEPQTTVNPFTDVKESDYFYKAVLWAYENGITTGATATTFDHAGTCTSAQVVTFLWRANGKPAAEHTGSLYYDEAVAWANANQLLDGTAVPFAPNNNSPRADIVTYLYRDLA